MNREIRLLTPDDLEALIRIRRVSFAHSSPSDPDATRARLEARLPWTWGSFQDGRLAAAAVWFPYRAWIGGAPSDTGALASVASNPEARRRGHVRALLADGLERLHDRGVGFALEHPFDPHFYEAMGFRTVPGAVALNLPLDRIALDPKAVDFAPASADERDEILRIHATYASRWTFALARDWRPDGEAAGEGPQWRRLLGDLIDGSGPTVYTTRGGYAVLEVRVAGEGEQLDVVDMAWVDAPARRRVLSMLGAWRGQATRAALDLPASDAIARDEGPRYGVRRATLQARIVDLPSALGPLKAPDAHGRGWILRVHDPFCGWNDGTWRVAPGPAGTTVERTRGGPDADLDVKGLVSLLTGVPPSVVLAQGEADGNADALSDLARLTGDHPPFLHHADHF